MAEKFADVIWQDFSSRLSETYLNKHFYSAVERITSENTTTAATAKKGKSKIKFSPYVVCFLLICRLKINKNGSAIQPTHIPRNIGTRLSAGSQYTMKENPNSGTIQAEQLAFKSNALTLSAVPFQEKQQYFPIQTAAMHKSVNRWQFKTGQIYEQNFSRIKSCARNWTRSLS